MLENFLKLSDAHIFVVGDIILDAYVVGNVQRISPEAPVPVVNFSSERFVLGGAANDAANIAAFGAHAWICGRIGCDADGEIVTNLCKNFCIHTDFVLRSKEVSTIRKTRILAGYQQIVRVDKEEVIPLTTEEETFVLRAFEEFLKIESSHKALIVSDYAKGFFSRDLVSRLLARASDAGIPSVTDPKSTDIGRYAYSTVIKPNRADAKALLQHRGVRQKFENLEEEARFVCKIYREHNIANVLLSLSEAGVFLLGEAFPDGLRIPSHVLEVADVSGAGDTLVSFVAMALAVGLPVYEAAQLANFAAGLVCQKFGTATLSLGEVIIAAHMAGMRSGVPLSWSMAQRVAEHLHAQQKRIVFTNGCFDILHAGHVTLLKKARSFGDVLFVGLNTDASIKRLKGAERPFQSEADRAFILSNLECVDFVVLFDDDTPLELIKRLRPDILVKGGDYTLENIVGAQEVLSWQGRVEIVPLVEGRSTTRIAEKMASR